MLVVLSRWIQTVANSSRTNLLSSPLPSPFVRFCPDLTGPPTGVDPDLTGLHSDWWSGCLDCRWNISMENKQIYIGTWQADRPWSRLHDDIVTCLIASKMTELFKISECRHWAPKFDIWVLKMILLFLLHFSIISSASLVVLVWELDCRSLHSSLILKWSLILWILLLLGSSRVRDDC